MTEEQNTTTPTDNIISVSNPPNVEGMLRVIAQFPYHGPFNAILELADNSLDAFLNADPSKEKKIFIKLHGSLDSPPTRIDISDNGEGVKYDSMAKMLTFGDSQYKEADGGTIGGFGQGLKSAFFYLTDYSLGSRLDVYSIHAGCEKYGCLDLDKLKATNRWEAQVSTTPGRNEEAQELKKLIPGPVDVSNPHSGTVISIKGLKFKESQRSTKRVRDFAATLKQYILYKYSQLLYDNKKLKIEIETVAGSTFIGAADAVDIGCFGKENTEWFVGCSFVDVNKSRDAFERLEVEGYEGEVYLRASYGGSGQRNFLHQFRNVKGPVVRGSTFRKFGAFTMLGRLIELTMETPFSQTINNFFYEVWFGDGIKNPTSLVEINPAKTGATPLPALNEAIHKRLVEYAKLIEGRQKSALKDLSSKKERDMAAMASQAAGLSFSNRIPRHRGLPPPPSGNGNGTGKPNKGAKKTRRGGNGSGKNRSTQRTTLGSTWEFKQSAFRGNAKGEHYQYSLKNNSPVQTPHFFVLLNSNSSYIKNLPGGAFAGITAEVWTEHCMQKRFEEVVADESSGWVLQIAVEEFMKEKEKFLNEARETVFSNLEKLAEEEKKKKKEQQRAAAATAAAA